MRDLNVLVSDCLSFFFTMTCYIVGYRMGFLLFIHPCSFLFYFVSINLQKLFDMECLYSL